MEPLPHDAELSLRRSRHRFVVLLSLASLGEAYVGQLARHANLDRRWVVASLEGNPPRYRVERSLVALGLARVVQAESGGRAYAITARGRRKARSAAKAFAREPRERKRLLASRQVSRHRADAEREGVPTPRSPPASAPPRLAGPSASASTYAT